MEIRHGRNEGVKAEHKDLAYYLSLPYTAILRRGDEGDVFARVEELEGCLTHGKDEVEALKNLASMKRLWLKDALSAGDPIPEPRPQEPMPSGKWVQRVPKNLHQKLARMARQEGVSLNQLVTQVLAEQVGARFAQPSMETAVKRKVAGRRPNRVGQHLASRKPSAALTR